MTLQDAFLERAHVYAKRRDVSHYTVSKELFGDPGTLKRMYAGGSCTLRKYELAVSRLSELEAELAGRSAA